MRVIKIAVDEIYIPAAKTKGFDEDRLMLLAEDILENGLKNPIYVRQGKGRYVLQEGLYRLEAIKLLGSAEIEAYIVQARKH